MTTTPDLPLAADFAQATQDDWRKLVDGVLKGAPFERLVSKTYDDLKIAPIYARAKGATPIAGRAAAMPWQIMQRVDHPDPAQGQCAGPARSRKWRDWPRRWSLPAANGAHGFGARSVAGGDRKDCSTASSSMPELRWTCRSARNRGMAAIHVAELIEAQGVFARQGLRHPLRPRSARRLAVWGSSPYAGPRSMPCASRARCEVLLARVSRARSSLADGRVVHDAGGSEAQELAFALAAARRLSARDGSNPASTLDAAQGMIYVRGSPPMPISS